MTIITCLRNLNPCRVDRSLLSSLCGLSPLVDDLSGFECLPDHFLPLCRWVSSLTLRLVPFPGDRSLSISAKVTVRLAFRLIAIHNQTRQGEVMSSVLSLPDLRYRRSSVSELRLTSAVPQC